MVEIVLFGQFIEVNEGVDKMATRCMVAKKVKNGYKAIYIHWDGYPEKPGVGWRLRKDYKSPAKVDKLIALGSLSSISEEIGRKHSFDSPTPGWSVAYHRDRGESWRQNKPEMFRTLDDLMDSASSRWANYLYVYEKGKWKTYSL